MSTTAVTSAREWRINAATQARESSSCKSSPAASLSHGKQLQSRHMYVFLKWFIGDYSVSVDRSALRSDA